MKAFGRVDEAHAIAGMNAINETIQRSLFMPVFFGSSIISVLLILIGLVNLGTTDATLVLVAGVIYFVGMFGCTVFLNVPLNNSLAVFHDNNAEAVEYWHHYCRTWTRWNHVRTVVSLTTCAMCILILTKGQFVL